MSITGRRGGFDGQTIHYSNRKGIHDSPRILYFYSKQRESIGGNVGLKKDRKKQICDAIKVSGERLYWIEKQYKRYRICGHISPYCGRLERWYDMRIAYPKGRFYFFAIPSNIEYCERVFAEIIRRDSGMVVE